MPAELKRTPSVSLQMPSKEHRNLRWRLGVLAALALVALSLYPQFDLWRTTGARAPYVSLWFDEACYSAYVNALVEASKSLLNDLDRCVDMGTRARSYARERFGLERFLSDWDRIIEEVVP